MPNHAHKAQVESSEPFPSGNLFPPLLSASYRRSRSSRTGLAEELMVAVAEEPSRKSVRVLEFPRDAARSSHQASERTALHHDWRFSPGDPVDGRDLMSASRPRLKPIAGDFLSPLEDDALPATRRHSNAEENFGCKITWVQPEFMDSEWAVVSLSDPARTQANGGGVCWYRRKFESPVTDESLYIGLEMIGGVGNNLVWLNGKCVGRAGSGSTELRRDITSHIVIGGTNTLVIRVEDWSLSSQGAGMAQSVSLVKKSGLHLAHGGNSIIGALRSGDRAELYLGTTLKNKDRNARRGTLRCTLLDPAGRTLAETEGNFHIFGQDRKILGSRLTIGNASWLADNPGKYLIRRRIILNQDIVDEEISLFDLRATLSDNRSDEFLSKTF